MRILFLTNFYPPHELGGQERSCQQVVEGLAKRGHQTAVLTSRHGADDTSGEGDGIYRWLYLEMDLVPWRHSVTFFTQRGRRERHNIQRLRQVLDQFKPDIVFVWGMWNLSWSLPAFAEAHCPEKVVYRFADYWPTLPSQHELYWRVSGRRWFTHLPKQIVGRLALALLARDNPRPSLAFEHTICVSAATRDILVQAGIPVADARIIYTGIEATAYRNGHHRRAQKPVERLNVLYAGRLAADKGVETAILAMARLKRSAAENPISLSLAGSGLAEYEAYLRQLVEKEGIGDCVSFLGQVPYAKMPSLLQHFDVLLVPSTWPEPFARVVLEGMVAGLVIVATPTGGTAEVVVDGENGLLFAAGDAHELAQKITALAIERELRWRLARAGQQTVVQRYTVARMLDGFESYLTEVALGANRRVLVPTL